MALSDKDIIITPNRGQSAEPKIEFKAADASTGPFTISVQSLPSNNGTLSFEGSSGQLFSITNSFSGSIFSVNDVSGIPSIEVLDTGTVRLAQFGGNVGIGTASPIAKLHVEGNLALATITAEPSSPPTGDLIVYTKAIAGRQMLKIKGPSGLDTPLQPILAQNKVCLWNANFGATTVPGVFGFPALTTVGTATARTSATTNILTRLKRIGYVSASGTTGQLTSLRLTTGQAPFTMGGDANSFGGFYTIIRFGISDAALVTVARMFVGMSSSVAAATNVDPATLTNVIGVGHNASDTNLYIYYGGSAAQTRINLGADFPVSITTAYELAIFAPPNSATTAYYRVTNLGTGIEASGTLTAATPGTQLPANTTLLGLQIWRTNNTSTSAVGIDLSSIYIETDY